MKVKHLLLIPILMYVLYLNVYTITHLELFYKNPGPFEVLAGVTFFASCGFSIILICFLISTQIDKIKNFLNQKIL